MRLELNPRDEVLARFGNGLAIAGAKAPLIMAMALNKECHKGRTEIKRALVKQTGLKLGAVSRAIKTVTASPSTLTYMLIARGGPVPLKYFSPREVTGGVRHTSPLDPNPYPGGFTRVGGFVARKGSRGKVFRMSARRPTGRFGGQVMENVEGGRWSGKVQNVMSSVSIPEAIVEGDSKAAFERIGPRVVDEVGRVLASYLDGRIPIVSRAKLR